METLGLLGMAVAFFGVGAVMIFYELARIKAKRPLLRGSEAVQLYWIIYLSMFVLGATTSLKAILG